MQSNHVCHTNGHYDETPAWVIFIRDVFMAVADLLPSPVLLSCILDPILAIKRKRSASYNAEAWQAILTSLPPPCSSCLSISDDERLQRAPYKWKRPTGVLSTSTKDNRSLDSNMLKEDVSQFHNAKYDCCGAKVDLKLASEIR